MLDESGWAKLANGCTNFRYPDDESPADFQLSDNKDVRELLISKRVIRHIFGSSHQEEKQSSSSSSSQSSISNGKQHTSSVSRKRPLEVVSEDTSSGSSPPKKPKLEESSSSSQVTQNKHSDKDDFVNILT